MDLINSKNKIIDEINTIIESYQSIENSHSNEAKLFTGEVERLNQFNNKLLSEIREKDKILSMQEKTIHDYSVCLIFSKKRLMMPLPSILSLMNTSKKKIGPRLKNILNN